MTEQERINAEVQTKLAMQDAKINVFTQEMKDFKEEMRDFKNEMRERDNQRAEDMREIRQSLNSNVRNMFITVIIGVGAMVVAVLLK